MLAFIYHVNTYTMNTHAPLRFKHKNNVTIIAKFWKELWLAFAFPQLSPKLKSFG